MTNPWMEHISKVRKNNPNLSYKECLVKGKTSYAAAKVSKYRSRYGKQITCQDDYCLPPAAYLPLFQPITDHLLKDSATDEKGKGKLEKAQAYRALGRCKVYRVWNSTNPRSERGQWWTFYKPKADTSKYREQYVICPSWSPLDRLSVGYLTKGMKVALGNGQSAKCNPFLTFKESKVQQVFIPDPSKLRDVKLCGKLQFVFR